VLSDGWRSATPMWELVLASTLLAAVIVLTCIGWLAFFRRSGAIPSELRRRGLLAGLTVLTAFLVLGAVLFLLPSWVVPHHDSIGVGWFFAFPAGMVLVLACGIASWRVSGRAVVGASLAGLSLWVLVATTVTI
jgi:hypothetical protein